jgi:aromatic-amino-acid transaminase
MRAVKEAERRLWTEQATKSYLGLLGDTDFVELMRELILGDTIAPDRIAGAQTPGGTGAVHQLAELVRRARPEATVWYSDPTWPNHPAILAHVGLRSRTYRYFDPVTCTVDFASMRADLAEAAPGDVVILHGCCHNPTGANLTLTEWAELTSLFAGNGVIPLVDLAYQGFGDGLEEDAAGLRAMAAALPELLIAASCSKNFGLYRDRVGAAFAIARTPGEADVTRGNLAALNRLTYSFPPDHGAKVVAIILGDPGLRQDWMDEVEAMRLNMLSLRQGLADALRRVSNSDRYDYIAGHRGMFTLLGGTLDQVRALREDHGIYMVGTGRINIAGLPANGLDRLAGAIAAVGI